MLATAASCLVVAIVLQAALAPRLSYPPSQKGDVVDDYFGTRVADPYRWMEDLDSKDVAEWVAAQNQVTSSYLATLPLRAHFERRIAALWDYPKVTLPVKEGGRYFYQKNSGLERQAPLYVRDTLNAPARVVLDPNQLSPDGSVSLTQWEPSRDGRLVAYALSEGGADWRTVRVRRVDEGTDLADEVRWVRFSAIAWTNDGRGFFYSRYPEPPKGKVLEAALANHALYYHRVGTAQAADTLVYARPDLPTWFLGGAVTEDGRYLIVSLARGAENTNRLYYADLGDPAAPNVGAVVTPLVEQDGAEFAVFGNAGPVLYLRTDRDAPNRAVVALDVRHPERARWRTVVAETRDAIESVLLVGNRIVIQYLADVQSRVSTFGVDGTPLGEVALPGTGTIAGLGGRQDDGELFYAFSSPLFPTTVFSYDLASKTPRPFEAARPAVDVDLYETRALFAPSKDGTRVPLFLTWRKGMALDGSHPTMLYGYGGFSVSMLPTYRTDVPAWLEQGGIWVTASLRGGAEYGESWHKAGRLADKQNVFDDFIAVAEYLVREKYTSPARLGVMGGSNGGLLVGAVEQQRPDLFAAAIPSVGVMDMLRYDRFTGGRAWVPEYGSSSRASDFPFLIKYSPVHNAVAGRCYPATLVITADHDDRVVPSHSFKFAAAMQAAQGCANPILIRVEAQGSHGYRPTDKRIAELADEWAFAAAALGMTVPPPS